MKPEDYYEQYINRGQHTSIGHLDQNRYLLKDGKVSGNDVWEMPDHPPFDKVLEYKTLKVDITKKLKVHVLIGSVMCFFYDGKKTVWFEIAMSQSKEALEIWKDLHTVETTKNSLSCSGTAETMKSMQ